MFGIYSNVMVVPDEYLEHSAKGTTWEKEDHKYLKKDSGKYYYKRPKRLIEKEKEKNDSLSSIRSEIKKIINEHPEFDEVEAAQEMLDRQSENFVSLSNGLDEETLNILKTKMLEYRSRILQVKKEYEDKQKEMKNGANKIKIKHGMLTNVLVVPDEYLQHSAKGSEWKKHKYIKRIDGTYYYPDDYKGGRHLPNGNSGKTSDQKDSDDEELEDWEESFYSDVEETLKKNPGLFDPTKLTSDDFQDFRLTLEEFAGIDTDDLSDEEIERMRKKVQDHYDDAKAARTLSDQDIENLANEVIRGNFANGADRKELLGENYVEVQKKVNEIMRSKAVSQKVSETNREAIKKTETAAKNVSSKPVTTQSSSKSNTTQKKKNETSTQIIKRGFKTTAEEEKKKKR